MIWYLLVVAKAFLTLYVSFNNWGYKFWTIYSKTHWCKTELLHSLYVVLYLWLNKSPIGIHLTFSFFGAYCGFVTSFDQPGETFELNIELLKVKPPERKWYTFRLMDLCTLEFLLFVHRGRKCYVFAKLWCERRPFLDKKFGSSTIFATPVYWFITVWIVSVISWRDKFP